MSGGAGSLFKVAARDTITRLIDGKRRVLEQSRRSPHDSWTFDFELNATTDVLLIVSVPAQRGRAYFGKSIFKRRRLVKE
jgi:hypothetical protein